MKPEMNKSYSLKLCMDKTYSPHLQNYNLISLIHPINPEMNKSYSLKLCMDKLYSSIKTTISHVKIMIE